MAVDPSLKSLRWIGSSKRDLRALPDSVKLLMGHALYVARQGGKHRDAKPFKGCGCARAVAIVANFHGDTFRAVYTVRRAGVVYVLHVFRKKSKAGPATPEPEMALIKQRLRVSERLARIKAR